MLSKLIKHEFRSTGRIFLFVYAAVIVMAIVNLVVPWEAFFNADSFDETTSNTILNIIMLVIGFLYGASVVVAIVVTLVVNITRFYKNLLGDEGYLMFTLPVTKDQLVISKLIVALVWNIGTYVIIFLSMLIMFGRFGLFTSISEGMREMKAMGFSVEMMLIMLILTLILGTISHLIMLYTASAVGPNMMKSRIGGSVVAYIIIYVIVQIISTAAIVVSGLFVRQSALMFELPASTATDLEGVKMLFNYGIGVGSAICIITIVVGYLLTRFMLNKKLNLA